MAGTTPLDPASLKAPCHYVRIPITLPSPPTNINECNCSVCYKLGAMWAYYPREQVGVATSSSTFPLSASFQPGASEVKPTTRGINTTVDEILDNYVETDLRGDRSGATFYRCAHCGALPQWWSTSRGRGGYGDESIMGVNCRLMPESKVVGVKRTVESG